MLVQRLRDAEGRKVFEKINDTAISPNAEELALLKDEQGSVLSQLKNDLLKMKQTRSKSMRSFSHEQRQTCRIST